VIFSRYVIRRERRGSRALGKFRLSSTSDDDEPINPLKSEPFTCGSINPDAYYGIFVDLGNLNFDETMHLIGTTLVFVYGRIIPFTMLQREFLSGCIN